MTTNLERAAKILADGISELKVDADLNQAATIIADSIAKLQKEPNYIDYLTAIGGSILAVIAIIGLWKILIEFKDQKNQFIASQNQNERNQISKYLNEFFAPLVELRSESKVLYQFFAKKEKNQCNSEGEPRFRTLRHLSQGKIFSPGDQALLSEIIDISKKTLMLIETKGYNLGSSALSDLLGTLGAHIRILNQAAEGKLKGMDRILEPLCFPKEVDGAIYSEILRLQDMYKCLLGNRKQKVCEKPYIGSKNLDAINHYNKNAMKYFFDTEYIDMSDISNMFLDQLDMGDLILDAGCGVGRDTKHFIKEGYRVISFDASEKMVEICNRYPFAYCTHNTFHSIKYIEEFDGVWACASLIHLSWEELKTALQQLYNATKSKGVIYFSLKTGDYQSIKNDGKTTYLYPEKNVESFMEETLKSEKIKNTWQNPTKKPNDSSIWSNYLYKKAV